MSLETSDAEKQRENGMKNGTQNPRNVRQL
jgi:hypothetical protein